MMEEYQHNHEHGARPNCCIIITTYNGAKWIRKCVDSCLASHFPAQILIIDNHSQDETLALLPQSERVEVFPQSQNLGFGPANNLGMEIALKRFGADYVFLLNQDAYLHPDALGNLIQAYENNPGLALLSPMHYGGDGAELDYRFTLYYHRSLRKLGKKTAPPEILPAQFVNAAAWLLPRKTMENIGGFDPVFYHTGEDDNYCQRIRMRGGEIAICTKAEIYHDRQARPQPKGIPYKRIDTRIKVVAFNPNMPLWRKCLEMVPLISNYLANLLLAENWKAEKLKSDRHTLRQIWQYAKRYRKLYQEKGIFLQLSENSNSSDN